MRMKLLKQHTHGNTPCVPGDEIDVSKPVADWMKARGIAALAAEPTQITRQRPDQTPTRTPVQEI